jgi:hypothetical protein
LHIPNSEFVLSGRLARNVAVITDPKGIMTDGSMVRDALPAMVTSTPSRDIGNGYKLGFSTIKTVALPDSSPLIVAWRK